MRTRRTFVVGVVALAVVSVAAVLAPQIVGTVLAAFSLVVFLIAVVGLARPEVVRLPNRAASVWVWALSFGLLIAGSTLLAPPDGDVARSDVPRGMTRQEGLEIAARREARLAREATAVAVVRTANDLRAETVCLENRGWHVVEAETEDPSEAAAIAILTRDDGTDEGRFMAMAQRLRDDAVMVSSAPVMLYEDPCYFLSAQTGVRGVRAWARLQPAEAPYSPEDAELR